MVQEKTRQILVVGECNSLETLFRQLGATGRYAFEFAERSQVTLPASVPASGVVLLLMPSEPNDRPEARACLDRLKPHALIVAFSHHEDMRAYLDAMWWGAFDYFSCETPVAEIERIIAGAVTWRLWKGAAWQPTAGAAAGPARGEPPAARPAGHHPRRAEDERDLLDLLKFELDFIESGGYGSPAGRPWKRNTIFLDSITCLNYGYPHGSRSCAGCPLLPFVPPEKRDLQSPCHYIPLDSKGATLHTLLDAEADRVEDAVKEWLRAKIHELERAQHAPTLP